MTKEQRRELHQKVAQAIIDNPHLTHAQIGASFQLSTSKTFAIAKAFGITRPRGRQRKSHGE